MISKETNQEFEVGKRYPMTLKEAQAIIRRMWPLPVTGKPDLSRGRLFVKAPADWAFWMDDKTKISFSFFPGSHFICSQSKEADPNIPGPLVEENNK